ncbi:LysR family transcriptional regulator [Paenochrobactrum sp. BZR 588]|uniref:LysR family transcriptional regulator n=1 Tax=unclassified Paenochrobactrum TaxID=2639760 RepID=UPI003853BEB6
MRLKPRQVEAFRSVIMTGSVTSASEMMNITQPAVSRLIRDLEDAVEMALFERGGARLIPTAVGVQFYREVERLYLGLDQLSQAANDIRQHKNTVLRIASVTSLVYPFLQHAILKAVGNRMDVPLVIDVENSRHIWDMVDKNRYDLGLVFAAPQMSDKNAIPLSNTHAVAALAPDHHLATRKVITPADLINERVLMPGRNSPLRLALDRAFSHEEHQPLSTMETSMLNCSHFAAAGMGVGIVDKTTLRSSGVDCVAIPFEPTIQVSYFAIRPTSSTPNPLLDDIINIMQELL